MKFYLVGGAVRDQLLQLPIKDRDWVVIGATPQAMLDQGFKRVGADFPVFLHPETKEEYALARQERKKGHGYKGFECFFSPDVSIEEDLLRRDLTINAMAQSENGEIIDPYNGQEDIANKKLRHVSDAFVEDPLRVLRVARFAARFHGLGFEVAEETNQLMRAIVSSGELDNLVPERVWQETQRALAEEHPEVFFEVLQTIGALKVLIPELEKLNGVPQPEEHHPEIDTWLHVKLCLQQAVTLAASNTVRFAVLMHDLGKGVTPQSEWPRHIAHEEKGLKLVKQLCQRLRVPNDYKELALMVCEFHTHTHRAQELKAQTVLKVLNRLDSHRKPQRFEDFLLACEIDAKGRTGLEHRPYPQREYLSVVANKIREIDIQALVKEGFTGPKLGEAIHKKRLDVINQVKDSFWQNQ